MEVIVTPVWLVYHDAASIWLKLEVAYAVMFYVSHYVWKHTLNDDSAYLGSAVLLTNQLTL